VTKFNHKNVLFSAFNHNIMDNLFEELNVLSQVTQKSKSVLKLIPYLMRLLFFALFLSHLDYPEQPLVVLGW